MLQKYMFRSHKAVEVVQGAGFKEGGGSEEVRVEEEDEEGVD